MSISSYYKEKEKLLLAQKQERAILLTHGIKSQDIDELHKEDYRVWKANRVYSNHNSSSSEELGETSVSLAWLQRNETHEFEEGAGAFLDAIENERLFFVLKTLSQEDIMLIKYCLISGVTQEEYALIIGKSRSGVTRKLGRIKRGILLALNK